MSQTESSNFDLALVVFEGSGFQKGALYYMHPLINKIESLNLIGYSPFFKGNPSEDINVEH